MDMETSNENADADHENPQQPPPQQPNTLQNDHASGSPVESHSATPANGDPVSQPNSQPAVQSSNTPNAQADVHPGTQTPPSAQGTLKEEEPVDPKGLLEPFGWDDLEERFAQKMHECQRQEGEIANEFKEWGQVFQAWASTTREYEEERLHKRLKTRMAWVRNSESTLEEKRQHYIKVVQAFERMLALMQHLITKAKEDSNDAIRTRITDAGSNRFIETNMVDDDDEELRDDFMMAEKERVAHDDDVEMDDVVIADGERSGGFHSARCVVS